MVPAMFLNGTTTEDTCQAYARRVAKALNIDRAKRVLNIQQDIINSAYSLTNERSVVWLDNSWIRKDHSPVTNSSRFHAQKIAPKSVPSVAYRVLDAPRLKDDYYCSVLAYSSCFRTLAVALTQRVYLWTEEGGVSYPPISPARPFNYVMSLAFSSDEGARGILAIARSSGLITLWGLLDSRPRTEIQQSSAATCLAFRPVVTWRAVDGFTDSIACEDLLVGDDSGCIHYYSVEWPDDLEGKATLLFKIEAHEQNICGLAWSMDGNDFASGGNDNVAAMFHTEDLFQKADLISSHCLSQNTAQDIDQLRIGTERGHLKHHTQPTAHTRTSIVPTDPPASSILSSEAHSGHRQSSLSEWGLLTPPNSPEKEMSTKGPIGSPKATERNLRNVHKYFFRHAAAVKAIAFAPWQPSLLATGGGSNDKQIHFHHTTSGTTLAVISVFAQVTSLVWSTTRREIAATFGYAQPEHQIRIAVFAWPSCQCTVSIPWEKKPNGEIGRALWAIPYPGGPNDLTLASKEDVSPTSLMASHMSDRADPRGRSDPRLPPSPATTPTRPSSSLHVTSRRRGQDWYPRSRKSRSEGEPWATRTQEEGSLIIACCDQTVKFFEIWAGKSKGKSMALGTAAGVLGGSKILEGWTDCVGVDEVGDRDNVIR